jgi:hypothetical protein
MQIKLEVGNQGHPSSDKVGQMAKFHHQDPQRMYQVDTQPLVEPQSPESSTLGEITPCKQTIF